MYSLADFGRMIGDRVRLDAYAEALRRVVTPDSIVLDIGAGTGIMSLLACQAGRAPRLRRRAVGGGPDPGRGRARQRLRRPRRRAAAALDRGDAAGARRRDRLRSAGRAAAVSPPTSPTSSMRATVARPGGAALADQRHAVGRGGLGPRGLRAPTERLAERAARAHAALGPAASSTTCWRSTGASRPAAVRARPVGEPRITRRSPTWRCGAPAPASITKGGVAHGLLVWFDTVLVEGVGYSNAPGAPVEIYGQMLFSWPEEVALRVGDRVAFDLRADPIGADYLWTWTTEIGSRDGDRARDALPTVDVQGFLPSADSLRRRAPTFAPALSAAGPRRWRCWRACARAGPSARSRGDCSRRTRTASRRSTTRTASSPSWRALRRIDRRRAAASQRRKDRLGACALGGAPGTDEDRLSHPLRPARRARVKEVPRPEPRSGRCWCGSTPPPSAGRTAPASGARRSCTGSSRASAARHAATGCDFAGRGRGGRQRRDRLPGRRPGVGLRRQRPGHARAVRDLPAPARRSPRSQRGSTTRAAACAEGAHYAINFLRKVPARGGRRALVNGATGAIGSAAVQLLEARGRARDRRVRHALTLALVQSLGADRVIDYLNGGLHAKRTPATTSSSTPWGRADSAACKPILKPGGIYISSELGPRAENLYLALLTPLLGGQKRAVPVPGGHQGQPLAGPAASSSRAGSAPSSTAATASRRFATPSPTWRAARRSET